MKLQISAYLCTDKRADLRILAAAAHFGDKNAASAERDQNKRLLENGELEIWNITPSQRTPEWPNE